MFSELKWLGAIVLGLGVLIVMALAWWVIVQVVRRRGLHRRRGSRHRPV